MSKLSTGAAPADRQGPPAHPRTIGWLGTSALAMGGSNQSLFLIGVLIAGQDNIPGQGSAAILLLIIGLVLGWMAIAGWTELILMWPDRVGGIAAACAEAFRPYAPVLANLTGVSYWWGWVPTCGLTALLSASAIQQWFWPDASVPALACGLVAVFTLVNLCGVHWAARLAIVIATASAILAFLSAVIPLWAGTVDWERAFTFRLETPFPGLFGEITSFMAGLYLVGFAAPAFEAAACHVGETVDRDKNVPRAMYASAGMATLYFLVLPVIWLGALGPEALAGELARTLGPTFAPVLGGLGKAAAIGFMMFNMFHGTLAPLTGVARTLSQIAEDGLLPVSFAKRSRTDCPWVAIVFTACCAIVFLLMGDPVWLVAAANFTYLIGISLPSVAVWLLRKDRPDLPRPYRAPRGTIMLGVVAAAIWGLSTVLGFQQFGLPTVLFGLGLAYSGSALYAWRKWSDRRKAGLPGVGRSLHIKLTGAMLAVLALDGAGYLLAVSSVPDHHEPLVAALEDIFVMVAIITIAVGLVLPGMIAHSAVEVAEAAERLARGTLSDFSRAMQALSAGDLDSAHARVDIAPVMVRSKDELGDMGKSFNTLQEEVRRAAAALDGAREGLRAARRELTEINASLEQRVSDRTVELEAAHRKLVETARYAGMAEVATGVLHNLGNVLTSVNVSAGLLQQKLRHTPSSGLDQVAALLSQHDHDLAAYLSSDHKARLLPRYLDELARHLARERAELLDEIASLVTMVEHGNQIVNMQQSYAHAASMAEPVALAALVEDAIRINLVTMDPCDISVERRYEEMPLVTVDKHHVLQILVNLLSNAMQALKASTAVDKKLTVRLNGHAADANRVVLQVIDNGIGITKENLSRIFEHGFTTKKDGRGFGLHSSAIAAQAIGGSLQAYSDGPGGGAVFTLDLPLSPVRVAA
jgi:signal transduction histidine kinase